MSECIYLVQMDVAPEREADFNRIYETQHVPEILKVPGVLAVERYKLEQSSENGMPTYLAIYRCASADIPQNAAWKKASDTGDWKEMVRPYTTNRRHSVLRKLP